MDTARRACFVLSMALVVAGSGGINLCGQASQSSTPPANPIHWVKGPITAKLGDNAEIDVPSDFLFTDGEGARKYMELVHNPVSNSEVGLIAPKSDNESWFILFEFDDVGFVKDDDKSSLDSAAILKSIQKGTEDSNEERRKKNWPAFHVNGWLRLRSMIQKPRISHGR
jgi:uncharacterized membrane-anchored protein